jgi:hypothetical protein
VFQHYLIFTVVAAATILGGCKEGAEEFFSGRPSEMAMVHNRIIAGPPEAMIDLLRVPFRFPDATESHIADWQESVIAWWWHPEKHELMIASFQKITREEAYALRDWVRVRHGHRSKEKAKALDEIEAAIDAEAFSSQIQYSLYIYAKPISGADGVKLAVLRKGRANLSFIWAAAHFNRLAAQITK